ncbi:MAG: glycosyltransferase family 2 protein [Nitrospira sp.]|nr:MAG: glycosyltransferase family 2 protein [Nitrospira sp.]
MATTAHGRNISERGENDCQFLFTVFTPTYNRGHTLKRVYESLKNQTCKNFEWLIIDDGSTDNTRGQVDEWCRQGQVTIRYEFQPNQGKHSAHNYALDLARGKFFLPLDSDDSCVPQALERFKCHWDTIPTEVRSEFSGVCALCVDQHGRLVGDRFPHDVFDSNSLEVTFRFRIKGEKWGFHRTDILKHFRFPAMANASFIPESFVWFAIARHYKERYVNEALRIYWSQPSDATEQDDMSAMGFNDSKKKSAICERCER